LKVEEEWRKILAMVKLDVMKREKPFSYSFAVVVMAAFFVFCFPDTEPHLIPRVKKGAR
jgi:hypothetical protein